jgi:hypothetical protein
MARGDLTDEEWSLIEPHLPLSERGPVVAEGFRVVGLGLVLEVELAFLAPSMKAFQTPALTTKGALSGASVSRSPTRPPDSGATSRQFPWLDALLLALRQVAVGR